MKGSGQLRLSNGRRLTSPPASITRPTTSRVREAVMNILAPRLEGSRWLDLCCGSGVMGCEAIERGAVAVTAIDRDSRCAATCKKNLQMVVGRNNNSIDTSVICADLEKWLRKGWSGDPFDLIYFDPPYDSGIYQNVMSQISNGQWLKPDGLMICEHRSKETLTIGSPWTLHDQRRYGNSSLLMLSLPEHCHDGTDSRPPQTDREG